LPQLVRDDQACRVSHEAIYQWVYAQKPSEIFAELVEADASTDRSCPRCNSTQ
jgi:hypothetical protein